MSEKTALTREPQETKKVPCEVYSRIVGYLRPVQNWNKGKRQEFYDRKPYHSQAGTADKEA
jgi:anaerobic ribonucleoside-triphosphate reductase